MNSSPFGFTLKAAFDADIETLGGQAYVERHRERLGIRAGQSLLSRYASVSDQHATTHVPVDVALAVCREIVRRGGVPRLLAELVDLCGFDMVPRAASAEPADCLARELGETARAGGELLGDMAEVVGDGRIDRVEAVEVKASARRVRENASRIEDLADQALGGRAAVSRFIVSDGPVRVIRAKSGD